jgi:uncharacterized protein YkwD
MKAVVVKIMIVGVMAAVLVTFGTRMAPLQAFSPPVVTRPQAVSPPSGVNYLEKIEDLVVELTNNFRRTNGLAPLSHDGELREVARAYSNDMLVRRFFDHTTPEGISFDERILNRYRHRVRFVGENIWYAYGYNLGKIHQIAKEIVDDWMTSPRHRANILDPDFTHLGVGVSGRNGTIRATQEFVGRSNVFSFRELFTP